MSSSKHIPHNTATKIYFPDTSETEINGKTFQVPNAFICPITLQLMDHPLVSRSGLNFERHAILSWLNTSSGTCPLTRKSMRLSDLIPNKHLEKIIWFWKENNGIIAPRFYDEEEDRIPSDCDFVGFMSFSNATENKILRGVRPTGAAQLSVPRSTVAHRHNGALRRLFRRRRGISAPVS
jgi:hypothetical protein